MHNFRPLLKLALLALAGCAQLPAWAVDTPIYTLQGSGAKSPLAGTAGAVVTTTGVVTKRNNNGFFIQDPVGDGNPATSDGIFVFTTTYTPAVGSLVRVAGTVVEFNVGATTNADTLAAPLTEISTVTAVTELATGYTIAPTVVTLPLAAGDSLERFEGMLVQFQGQNQTPLTVQQNFYQARYGQLTIGAGGRHETPTNRYRPGAQADALTDLQARSRFLLDDGNSLQNVNPTPYFYANGLGRAGDTVDSLTGVLDYGLATSSTAGAGLYRLHPTLAPVFTAANPRPAAPDAVGGNVRVASLNVLNFFTTFTNGNDVFGNTGQGCLLGGASAAGNCRGADSLAEFVRQRDKIVREMAGLNADVYGIMETQNTGTYNAQGLVKPNNVSVQYLADQLNAYLGSAIYAAIAVPEAGTGTDAIRVSMIYKPAKLTPVGLPASDTDPVNNRPTLAQTFVAANGEKFSLVVNHLKSKSSCPISTTDVNADYGQGCWNATRTQQAQRLRTFVAQVQVQGDAGSNDVLLVGDFNAYAQEDPIYELTSNGFVDQIARFNTLGYSYVFDGTAGRLDHAIANSTLSPKVTGAVEWHINADEQTAFDYNLEFKQPACTTCAPDPYDASGPYRASDHDPVVIGLDLYKTVAPTAPRQLLTGTPGADRYVYTSVLQGGGSISGFQPGTDQLVIKDLLAGLNLGGLSDPLGNGNISCVSSRLGAVISIDTDGAAGPLPPRALVQLNGLTCAAAMSAQNFVWR